MRSRISTVIALIFLVILIFLSYKGIKVGEFEVLSISELIEKNDYLEEKIAEASQLSSENYPQSIDELEETYDQYIAKKQKYEQLVGVTSSTNSEIYETKQYDISYLWRVLGKYATNRSLELGIDAQKSKNTKNAYNFNFSVSGSYVNISQFITDIENDSDLYFRIYSLKMVPDSESGTIVTATFTVRNIGIDSSTISK